MSEDNGEGSWIFGSREADEQYRYSRENPAFSGRIEFDLTFEVFRERTTRRVRAEYKHTPEWEYFDTLKQAHYVGWAGTEIGLSLLTVPDEEEGDEEYEDEEQPAWVNIGELCEVGVLPRKEFWERLDALIEVQCRAVDAKRRAAARK